MANRYMEEELLESAVIALFNQHKMSIALQEYLDEEAFIFFAEYHNLIGIPRDEMPEELQDEMDELFTYTTSMSGSSCYFLNPLNL